MRRWAPLLLAAACAAPRAPEAPPRPTSLPALPRDERLTVRELQSLVMAFADRAMESTVEATQRLIERDPSAATRRNCLFVRLYVTTVAYSCAVQPNPEVALLDAIVGVSVQRFVLDGPRGGDLFAPEPLREVRAHMASLEEQAWALGARALGEEQRADLRALLDRWKADHAGATYAGFVRFEDFAAARDRTSLAGVERRGVLRLLAPIDETNRQIEETRLFAERALFLLQRAPFLARWQAEVFAYDMLGAPEVRRALDGLDRSAAAADALAKSATDLPATVARERERLLEAFDARERSLRALLAESREAIAEGRLLAADAQELARSGERLSTAVRGASEAFAKTVEGADRLVARLRDPGAPGGAASFDVEKYAAAIERLSAVAAQANEALASTERLLSSAAFRERLREVDDVANRRVDHFDATARGWIDLASARALQVGGAGLLLALLYRFLAARVAPRRG